jgi:hypothetical protein
MFPVADDFASIARRLKEIQAEVARERAAEDARRQSDVAKQPAAHELYEDIAACV